jgi:hypothetical protein
MPAQSGIFVKLLPGGHPGGGPRQEFACRRARTVAVSTAGNTKRKLSFLLDNFLSEWKFTRHKLEIIQTIIKVRAVFHRRRADSLPFAVTVREEEMMVSLISPIVKP